MSNITEDQIRERAHRIWMEDGCQHGRDVEHWHQARQELEAEANGTAPSSADLDTALAASFPASDPIAFTPVSGVGMPDDEADPPVEAQFAGTR